jgi:hypothetical protein
LLNSRAEHAVGVKANKMFNLSSACEKIYSAEARFKPEANE